MMIKTSITSRADSQKLEPLLACLGFKEESSRAEELFTCCRNKHWKVQWHEHLFDSGP